MSLTLRNSIDVLESEILAQYQHEIPIKHTFSGGMYAREGEIKKGTTVTGRVHKTEHLNFLVTGDITVVTEDGSMRLKAPCTIASKPGTKRVAYAHEDSIWITVLKTDLTDPARIEAELTAPNHDFLLSGVETLAIGD